MDSLYGSPPPSPNGKDGGSSATSAAATAKTTAHAAPRKRRRSVLDEDIDSSMYSTTSSTTSTHNNNNNNNNNNEPHSSKTTSNKLFLFKLTIINLISTIRHRLYKFLVFACIIYPLYLFRKWGERYTQKQTNRRQKQRCEAILQSTEEYVTWKSVATILDSFAGYDEWKKYCRPTEEELLVEEGKKNNKSTKNNKLSKKNMVNGDDNDVNDLVDGGEEVQQQQEKSSSSSGASISTSTANETSLSSNKIKRSMAVLVSYFSSQLPVTKNISTNSKKYCASSSFSSKKSTPEYDEEEIEETAEFVDKILATNSEIAMGTYIRSSLSREMFGLGCPELHKYYCGSKDSIEHYLTSIETLIKRFVSKAPSVHDDKKPEETEEETSDRQRNKEESVDIRVDNEEEEQRDNEDDENNDDDDFSSSTSYDEDEERLAHHVGPHHLELLRWAKKDGAAATTEANHAADHHQTKNVHTLSSKEKFLLLKDAAQSFGRTALLLSGGASLGMYHCGVIRSLFNANILPKIISGSSAGAIIAAIFCVRTDEECAELLTDTTGGGLEEKVSLNAFDSYDDPLTSISTRIWRLIKTGAFMDVQVLMDCMRSNCGDLTFAEAYKRTGRILNIAIASVSREGGKNAKSMVLNYVTAPNVLIWTGVAASCAYPKLFTEVQLLQKHPVTQVIHPYLPGQRWNDGSITADLPKERLAELFNANFFIVSQVNPHVAPFIRPSLGHLVHKKSSKILQAVQNMWFGACEELRYWILKCFRHEIISLEGENEMLFLQLSQSYSGDVTIRPIRSFFSALPDYVNLTANPTKELLQYVTGTAQRRTWPHVSRIHANMRIELALDAAMNELRQNGVE